MTPGALPPTGSTPAGANQPLFWAMLLALGGLVSGATFLTLARVRR